MTNTILFKSAALCFGFYFLKKRLDEASEFFGEDNWNSISTYLIWSLLFIILIQVQSIAAKAADSSAREAGNNDDNPLPKIQNEISLPKKGEAGNFAVVRVWLHGKKDVGHVSLQTPRYYISLWPTDPVEKSNGLDKIKPLYHDSYEEDKQAEGCAPDAEICLYSLEVDDIERRYEEVILPKLQSWRLTGEFLTNFNISLLSKSNREHYHGISEHSCASLILDLLKVGGIAEIIPHGSASLRLGRALAGGTVMGISSATAGFWTGMATATLQSPKILTSQALKKVGIFEKRAETWEKEADEAIVSSAVTGGKYVGGYIGQKLVYMNKTNYSDQNQIERFELSEVMKTEHYDNNKKNFEKCINRFEHPADALSLNVATPDDIFYIIYVAKLFEGKLYPQTLKFPHHFQKKFHNAHVITKEFEKLEVSANGWTELHTAARKDDIDTVKRLWQDYPRERRRKTGHGHFDGEESLLHIAAKWKSLKVLEFILSKDELSLNGLDQNRQTPLQVAIKKQYSEIEAILRKVGKEALEIQRTEENNSDCTRMTCSSSNLT